MCMRDLPLALSSREQSRKGNGPLPSAGAAARNPHVARAQHAVRISVSALPARPLRHDGARLVLHAARPDGAHLPRLFLRRAGLNLFFGPPRRARALTPYSSSSPRPIAFGVRQSGPCFRASQRRRCSSPGCKSKEKPALLRTPPSPCDPGRCTGWRL